MPRSMTGYARQETQHPWGQLICEVRSVNHRYLEPTFRLSDSFKKIETQLRDNLRKRLGRGKVEVVVAMKTEDTASVAMQINLPLARNLLEMADQINALCKTAAPVDSFDILKWPGVLIAQELDHAMLEQEALAQFDATLTAMIEAREREGQELSALIEQRLQGIATEVDKVRARYPEVLAAQETKLRARLEALQVEVDKDRLTQELVYLAQKSDIAEELDRLEAHITEVRRTLKQKKEPIGRRLDFLMQELNREANTLSSKAIASDITQSSIEVKVLIEQMREQVQNIE